MADTQKFESRAGVWTEITALGETGDHVLSNNNRHMPVRVAYSATQPDDRTYAYHSLPGSLHGGSMSRLTDGKVWVRGAAQLAFTLR